MKLKNVKLDYVTEVQDEMVSDYLGTKEWEKAVEKPKPKKQTAETHSTPNKEGDK